jgi:putative ABC transport system substrate-binding protein
LRRRRFVELCTAAALAAPITAEAQRAKKVHRIGVLSQVPTPSLLRPVVTGLGQHGWMEGRDFILDVRATEGDPERAATLAQELVRRGVDLILTITTPLAVAARRASRSIPIVMITSGYPVEAGLAASLAQPGGNVTGNSVFAGVELFGKYLELFKILKPQMKRLAVLWDWVPPNILAEETEASLAELRQAATRLSVSLHFHEVRTRRDLDQALSAISGDRVDALFATSGPVHVQPDNAARLVQRAAAERIPTMTDFRGHLFEAGILVTYSPDPVQLGHRAADFVDRILRGAKPGDLPIERPSKFDLVLNLQTARALGLTIPPSLRLRATQVIP